jgi:hypothetical protein
VTAGDGGVVCVVGEWVGDGGVCGVVWGVWGLVGFVGSVGGGVRVGMCGCGCAGWWCVVVVLGQVSEINIAYFDTVPVAQSLVILKTGFLFVASEFGNHALYQVPLCI